MISKERKMTGFNIVGNTWPALQENKYKIEKNKLLFK